MPDKVFLTETRRDVLDGKYEGSNSSRRAHESRIRKKSEIALNELIEVAESQQIDNTEVFDPDDVYRLLHALLTPIGEIEKSGLVKYPDDVTDEYAAYMDQIYIQLDTLLHDYREKEKEKK